MWPESANGPTTMTPDVSWTEWLQMHGTRARCWSVRDWTRALSQVFASRQGDRTVRWGGVDLAWRLSCMPLPHFWLYYGMGVFATKEDPRSVDLSLVADMTGTNPVCPGLRIQVTRRTPDGACNATGAPR